MFFLYPTLFFFLLIFLSALLVARRKKYPPGPRGPPLIGNALQLRSKHPEVVLESFSREYGNLMYLTNYNQPMLVLNDIETARDLLERRSAIYSDRPRLVLLNELMGWSKGTTTIRYGSVWRRHRRFMQQAFNQRATEAFRTIQKQETLLLLNDLIRSPHAFVQHLEKTSASIIFLITYGYKIASMDDPFVVMVTEAANLTVESGTPTAALVDNFPLLKHIPTKAPFSGFKRQAIKARKLIDDVFNIPFGMVQENMRAGKVTPSFTSTLLESYGNSSRDGKDLDPSATEDDVIVVRDAAGTLFFAAQETTTTVMQTFLITMIRHPYVYKRAQDEMDRVVGNSRLPTPDDRPSLPYLECVLKEVIRWNPPVPLGLPHRLMEDDVYQGYYIPAGTNVFANIYGMLRQCSRPDEFIPERYSDSGSGVPDPQVIFGFGRRVCPGRYFADTTVWTMMSCMVATLNISASAEDRARGTVPSFEVKEGITRHPIPFKCDIRPRSDKVARLIEAAQLELGV